MGKQTYRYFKNNLPKVVVYLPEGGDAEKLYKDYQKALEHFPITDWSRLEYVEDSERTYGISNMGKEVILGSNNVDQGVINHLLRNSGLRVAVPRDDFHGDISAIVRGKYFTDFNATIGYQNKPSCERDKGLHRKILDLGEEKNGSVYFPFMIQGFYTLPDENEECYGVKIVPGPNFKIFQDDRFSGKYNEMKFEEVDEIGLPVKLKHSAVGRTWLTKRSEDGLSRLCLSPHLNLGYMHEDIINSGQNFTLLFVNDTESTELQTFRIREY